MPKHYKVGQAVLKDGEAYAVVHAESYNLSDADDQVLSLRPLSGGEDFTARASQVLPAP